MSISKKRYESNKKYNDKTYEQLGFRSRKEERLDELIALGATETKQTKSIYMKNAILAQLSRDGITIDMLPSEGTYTPPVEPTQLKKYQIYLVTEEDVQEQFFEEYVSTFPTIKAAMDYIKRKFRYKAYPEQWKYIIYGRDIEANTKRDAFDIHRDMVKKAIAEADEMFKDVLEGEIKDFLQILNEKQEPDLVEPVTYDDVKGDE